MTSTRLDAPSAARFAALRASPALAALWPILPAARLVGGAVRDLLAGVAIGDLDLATPDTPDMVQQLLRAAGLRGIPTGLAHGTITALVAGTSVEITTLRQDVATDGRHAIVAFTDDWQQDAARRDFTINALSIDAHGRLFDYFGGRDDLAAGRLRFIGAAAQRIAEDRLRMLRYFRFQARFGHAGPDEAALEAIAAAASGVATLSAERVWSEFAAILALPDPGRTIGLMAECRVLAALLPEGARLARLARLLAAGAPTEPILRLAALLGGPAPALAARLRLSGAEATRLCALRGGRAPHPALGGAALRRLLADTPKEILLGRSWLHGDGGPAWQELRQILAALPVPEFPLGGRDALALGVPPGPGMGALLGRVRRWWLAGGCLADAEACRAELARQVAA